MSGPGALAHNFVGGRRRHGSISWLLLVVGAVFIGIALVDWQAARDEAERWSAKSEHWQAMVKHLSGAEAVSADAAALRPQVAAAAKAIDRLATPWSALFLSLEDSIDDGVSLLAVTPDVDKGEVRLSGEAKDFAALRNYLKRLGDTEALTDVRLLGQDVRRSDAQHPIVFTIVGAWRRAS